MQAIRTRFLPRTDKLAPRIVASCASGKIRIVIKYDFLINDERNHIEAAKQLRKKLCWNERMTWGYFGGDYFFTLATNNGSDRSF
jgi:hypothetical protein